MFDVIGPVFLFKTYGWKKLVIFIWYNGSLDFMIASESREGNIAICINDMYLLLYLWSQRLGPMRHRDRGIEAYRGKSSHYMQFPLHAGPITCSSHYMQFPLHAVPMTCSSHYMQFPLHAVPITCSSHYMQFPLHAVPITCSSHYMQFPLHAVPITCSSHYMQFSLHAVPITCSSHYMQFPLHAVPITCSSHYMQFPLHAVPITCRSHYMQFPLHAGYMKQFRLWRSLTSINTHSGIEVYMPNRGETNQLYGERISFWIFSFSCAQNPTE